MSTRTGAAGCTSSRSCNEARHSGRKREPGMACHRCAESPTNTGDRSTNACAAATGICRATCGTANRPTRRRRLRGSRVGGARPATPYASPRGPPAWRRRPMRALAAHRHWPRPESPPQPAARPGEAVWTRAGRGAASAPRQRGLPRAPRLSSGRCSAAVPEQKREYRTASLSFRRVRLSSHRERAFLTRRFLRRASTPRRWLADRHR